GPVGLEQFGVGAAGGDAAAFEEDDLVGQGDGGAAVGDDEHAGGLGGALEPGEDLRFDLGVDGAGGVVEDEQAGVAGEGAGEGDPLALAAGEAGAALAELGVQAVLEVADELVGPGGGQSLPDAGVVDALAVERDV